MTQQKTYAVVTDTRTGEIVHKAAIPEMAESMKLWTKNYPEPQYYYNLVEEAPTKEERTYVYVTKISSGEVVEKVWDCPENWKWLKSSYPEHSYRLVITEEELPEDKNTYLVIKNASTGEVVQRLNANLWATGGKYQVKELEKNYPVPPYQIRLIEEVATGNNKYVVVTNIETGEIISRINITSLHPREVCEGGVALQKKYPLPHYCVGVVEGV
jgi:predicted small secreted protein